MVTLQLPEKKKLSVLCLGAHCDDIEIGCGGTLLQLLNKRQNIHLHWHILTSTPSRKQEAEDSAKLFSAKAATLDIHIQDFRDGYLPYSGSQVKETIQEIAATTQPDLIFTHYRNDLHQDHRKVSELTWNAFRNNLILEYEIPKWDGDVGNPNTYVIIDRDIAEKKVALLQQAYNSQRQKTWFTDDLFLSLMRIRGMEVNSPSLLAEAYYMRKSIIALSRL